jgi:hypothetical protein
VALVRLLLPFWFSPILVDWNYGFMICQQDSEDDDESETPEDNLPLMAVILKSIHN